QNIPTQDIKSAYDNKFFSTFLTSLKEAIILYRLKIKLLDKIEDEQCIASFIYQRINNFTDNPSAMIDSCLKRRKTSIILDKVLVKDEQNQPYLEFDPSNVLSHT
ncbi:17062_t:CDS:1, partial [Funneliformis geosporum]